MKQVKSSLAIAIAIAVAVGATLMAVVAPVGAQGARPSITPVTPSPTTPALGSVTSTVPQTGTQTDSSGTTVPKITPAPPTRG